MGTDAVVVDVLLGSPDTVVEGGVEGARVELVVRLGIISIGFRQTRPSRPSPHGTKPFGQDGKQSPLCKKLEFVHNSHVRVASHFKQSDRQSTRPKTDAVPKGARTAEVGFEKTSRASPLVTVMYA